MMMEELFGEVISTYTDEQALDDGFLVDVSEMKTPYKWPVYLTRSLYNLAEKTDKDYVDIIVWDITFMAAFHPVKELSESKRLFRVVIGTEEVELIAAVGHSYKANGPAVTICYPHEV